MLNAKLFERTGQKASGRIRFYSSIETDSWVTHN